MTGRCAWALLVQVSARGGGGSGGPSAALAPFTGPAFAGWGGSGALGAGGAGGTGGGAGGGGGEGGSSQESHSAYLTSPYGKPPSTAVGMWDGGGFEPVPSARDDMMHMLQSQIQTLRAEQVSAPPPVLNRTFLHCFACLRGNLSCSLASARQSKHASALAQSGQVPTRAGQGGSATTPMSDLRVPAPQTELRQAAADKDAQFRRWVYPCADGVRCAGAVYALAGSALSRM